MAQNIRMIKSRANRFLSYFGNDIKTKINNLCGKTGQLSVPTELFQKRTSRSNRCLISWKTVKSNRLTIKELNGFKGGVVVELINNDFFDEQNYTDPTFNELINRIGSDENVSTIITIRSEDGKSSSSVQREAYRKLLNNTKIKYKGNDVVINESNYKDYKLIRNVSNGKGNDVWEGFLYISIKGGQQDTIETHKGEKTWLLNPAADYASEEVADEITLIMQYYALFSVDENELKKQSEEKWRELKFLKTNIENIFKECEYDNPTYKGNLYDFVKNFYPLIINSGHLYDPISIVPINIEQFANTARTSVSLDFTHDEAVIKDRYYWDNKKKVILSPARPTNVFWSNHESNMMQQDYTIEEFYKLEDERYEKRHKLLK